MIDLNSTQEPSLTVVISTGQSRNPEKRSLEQSVAEFAAALPGVCVLTVPHLYDMGKESKTFQTLRSITGDLVVLCWLFDRATHWILDRNGVRGQVGEVLLREELDEDEVAEEPEMPEDVVINAQPRPDRSIFCIDFRASNQASEFHDELERILSAATVSEPDGMPSGKTHLTLEMLERFANPTNDTYVGSSGPEAVVPENDALQKSLSKDDLSAGHTPLSILKIEESPGRRWYPVIDFSRCTNCMECIDFCLFGVYGVDAAETIVVEQADNCRKGCPACSRVCPQNAIIFPQHKTPAIAGAPVDASGMKIDLSKLFGAPESDEDAAVVAARERDEQLLLAGREAVGATTSKRRSDRDLSGPKSNDEFDAMLDELDSLDL